MMAQKANDAEFWLPPEFLTEEELLMEFKTECYSKKGSNDFSSEWFRKIVGFSSDPGSAETESDEYEHCSPHPASTQILCRPHGKGVEAVWFSTINSSGVYPGSGCDSPNYGSWVFSETKGAVGWDLLYAAAEEVARMRKFDETASFYSNKLSAPTQKPIPVHVPHRNPSRASCFYGYIPEMGLPYQRLQATQLEHMKEQQMMKSAVWGQAKTGHQFQNRNVNEGAGKNPGLSMAAWPTIQQSQQKQQPGSGFNETGPKKERIGTGVFLPRRFEPNPPVTETRKKSGCPVLLPDRVVHALNLNLDSMDSPSHHHGCNANMAPQYDAALKLRNNGMMAQPRTNFRAKLPVNTQELRLPQEWTY